MSGDAISPANSALPPGLPPCRQRTAGAGFVLRERLAIYPEFSGKPAFVNARLQPHVRKFQGENGYAREGA